METLYINTCNFEVIVKLIDEEKIVKEKVITNVKSSSEYLLDAIKEVSEDSNIRNIVVANGPGSFTGVRIGVTVAKTLAYLKSISIFTVSTLEEIAISNEGEYKFTSLPDNKGYYVAEFDCDDNLVGDYKYLSKDEYTNYIKEKEILKNKSIDYVKVVNKTINKKEKNPHLVNPLYVKVIDALK